MGWSGSAPQDASSAESSPAGRISWIRAIVSPAYSGPASTSVAGPPAVAGTGLNTGRPGDWIEASRI